MSTAAPTAPASTDRIEKSVVLDAPPARVWRALTDVAEFNRWFGIALTSPFAPGAEVRGALTNARYAHVIATLWVDEMVPERRFSFRWHPYALDTSVDYSAEPTTLVTLTLEDVGGGTRLTVVESGFDAIPEWRRAVAFRSNANGWAAQLENLRRHVAEG